MKRLSPWAFNLAALLSAVLCLGAGAAWVRSYWAADTLVIPISDIPHATRVNSAIYAGDEVFDTHVQTTGAVVSLRGSLRLYHWQLLRLGRQRPSRFLRGDPSADVAGGEWEIAWRRWSFAGVSWCEWWRGGVYKRLIVPDWLILSAGAILPAVWVRRRRRSGTGYCRSCGYDLRATPTRCPECGEAPVKRCAT